MHWRELLDRLGLLLAWLHRLSITVGLAMLLLAGLTVLATWFDRVAPRDQLLHVSGQLQQWNLDRVTSTLAITLISAGAPQTFYVSIRDRPFKISAWTRDVRSGQGDMTVTVTYFKAGLGKTVVGIVLGGVEVLSYDETARRASEKVSKDLNIAKGLAVIGALLIVLFFIPFLLRRRPSADGRDLPLMLDKFIVWDGVKRPAEGETYQEQFERQSYWLANKRRGSFEEKPQLLDLEEAPITANGYRQRAAKAIEAAEEIERQLAALAAGEQLNVGRKLSTGLKFIVWDGVNRPAEGMTNEEFLRRYRWPRWPQWGKRRRRYIGVTLLNLEEAPRWANRDRENAAKAIAVAEDIERQFAALQAKPGSG